MMFLGAQLTSDGVSITDLELDVSQYGTLLTFKIFSFRQIFIIKRLLK